MNILWIWLCLINLITFALFAADKFKAVHGQWRIRERTLLLFCLAGGAAGGLFSMLLFRHKTRTPIFQYGIPAMLILWVLLLFILLKTMVI